MLLPFYGELEPVLFVVFTLFPILFVVPITCMYFSLRWRDAKEPSPDPDLGIKFGLHFLMTGAILVLVSGASVLAASFLSQIGELPAHFSWKTDAMRTGSGLMLSGGAMTPIFFYMLWMKTNDAKQPTVRRLFQGCRLIVSGIVAVFTLTLLMIAVFADSSVNNARPEAILGALGVFSVWASEMCLAAFLLMISRPQPVALPSEVPGAKPDSALT